MRNSIVALLLVGAGPAMAETAAPPGALACTGCHGARTTEVPQVRGRDPAEIAAAMAAFRSGERPATVMDRIAKGFTDDEARAIAAWLKAQP